MWSDSWLIKHRMFCPHFFLTPSYWEVQLALENLDQVFTHSIKILTSEKTTWKTTCKPSLNSDSEVRGSFLRATRAEVSTGPIRIQPPYSAAPIRTGLSHDAQNTCAMQGRFLNCMARNSWLLDRNHTSWRESKRSTREARETLHPVSKCGIAVCDHSDPKMDFLFARFSTDLGFLLQTSQYLCPYLHMLSLPKFLLAGFISGNLPLAFISSRNFPVQESLQFFYRLLRHH